MDRSEQQEALHKAQEVVHFVIEELCEGNINASIYLLIKLENSLKDE